MSPPSSGDDIPVARRAPLRMSRPRGPWQRIKWVLVGGALALASSLLFLPDAPLGDVLFPPPVPGLAARPDSEGRLLGHFPYPQVAPEQLVETDPGQRLRPDAGRSLEAMRNAAADDGIDLVLLSAFRDAETQRTLFFDVKSERAQNAEERALVSAPPGYSEHSTGFAVDLGDARVPQTHLSTAFEDTEGFRWLERNAARFHFRLSFPRGNAQGVSYEPWHWRYEGSTEALRLFEPARALTP